MIVLIHPMKVRYGRESSEKRLGHFFIGCQGRAATAHLVRYLST